MTRVDATTNGVTVVKKDTPNSTKRSSAYLERLAKSGGAPVRVDLSGDDLKLVDSLVESGYARSRAEAFRVAMRKAHKAHIGAYTPARIAWEIERTAQGDGFFGNAIRVAKDIQGLTQDDRSLLDRFASGIQSKEDHQRLLALALRIDAMTPKG